MRKGGGKAKGNSYERKICRIISKFWSNDKHKDLCWRSASSGAKGTITRTKTKAYHGDLVATSPLIEPLFQKFCIELKHYKKIDEFSYLRDVKNQGILPFWKQTVRSARLSQRIPILIYKANNKPDMIVCEEHLLATKHLLFSNKPIRYISFGGALICFTLESFLRNVNRENFIQWVSCE